MPQAAMPGATRYTLTDITENIVIYSVTFPSFNFFELKCKVFGKGAWGRTFFTKKVSTKIASFATRNELQRSALCVQQASSPKN